MATSKGRDFLVQIWNTDLATPAYQSLGGTTEASLSIGNGSVDVTDKFSNGNRETLANAGTTTWDISASGYVKNQEAYLFLQGEAHANNQVKAQITNGNGDTLACNTWDITAFEINGGFDNAEGFSITLASGGVVTYTESGGSAESRAVVDPDA